MTSISSATVHNASAANPGTVRGAAAVAVLRKAMDMQTSAAAQLIAALPQPTSRSASAPADASRTVGAIVDLYA